MHWQMQPPQWLFKDTNFGLSLLTQELHNYSGDGIIQSLCSIPANAEDFKCFIILQTLQKKCPFYFRNLTCWNCEVTDSQALSWKNH